MLELLSRTSSPDLGPRKATARQIVHAVKRFGFAIIRSAISRATLNHYRDKLDLVYRLHDAALSGDREAEATLHLEGEELRLLGQGDVWPALFARVADDGSTIEALFETPLLNTAVRALAGPYRPYLSTFMSVSACAGKSMAGIPLHTDGIIQGNNKLTITLWAPFQECGHDSPGLTLVTASYDQVLAYLRRKFPDRTLPGWCSTTEWNSTNAFDEEAVKSAFGQDCVWQPVFRPGDIACFTNWTIHGSYVRPTMTGRRTTAIARSIAD